MYKKINVNPENFLKDSIHPLIDKEKTRESYRKMENDEKLDLKRINKINPKELIIDFPEGTVKNEIVWNYKNTSGLCNLSAMMYYFYIKFTLENLNELIVHKNNPEVVYQSAKFPEICLALYYGQTVYALYLYAKEAMNYENKPNKVVYDHYYTHFKLLGGLDPNMKRYERYDNDMDVYTYCSNTKDDIFNNFIINSEGYFKCHESNHACFLALTPNKAIYVNNSLLSDYPLVCDKKDLVKWWKIFRRWKRERLEEDYTPNISLFDVVKGLNRINEYETMNGGGEYKRINILPIIAIIVVSIIIIIVSIIIMKEYCSNGYHDISIPIRKLHKK